jgi:enoyl-CoA hydratase
MNSPATYSVDGNIATIRMDDGKVNALSLSMFRAINAGLDQAEKAGAVVVLEGRDGVFSAGFDLKTLQAANADTLAMVRGGFELARRLLSYPQPVVITCTGHAVAMGFFLLLSGDYRVGANGPFRLVANEVAMGLTMPRAAVEVCRQRLTPACLQRALLLSETFSPDNAVNAGILDVVVSPDAVRAKGREMAAQLAALNLGAHEASKKRIRGPMLESLRQTIEADAAELSSLAS